jgi:dTDP-D-glucose 4,6-dehydratase
MKNAIVFGGAGFIGSHLLKRFAETRRYDRLYGVDIEEPRFTSDSVDYVNFDIRQPIPTKLCGDGPFDFFNFAAVHVTGREDWKYYWTNVNGATNVCRFATDVNAEYIKTDIDRTRMRKLYQSTNTAPGRLQKLGFNYAHNLRTGLSAWKQSSRVTDFN